MKKWSKKILAAFLAVLLSFSVSMPGFAESQPLPAETQVTEEESTLKTAVDEPLLSEQGAIADVSGSDVRNQETDVINEAYIRTHLDPAYAEYGGMKLVNALYAKQALFDGSAFREGDTPESVLSEIEASPDDADSDAVEKFITQMSGLVGVYDVDENSDYYVSFVNTLQDTPGVKTQDAVFAWANDYAELLDGCHYDKRTGLAYLPKELFGRDLLSIQVQLMHVLSDYEDAMTEVDTAGGRKSENYTTLSSLIDQETVVQAASGLKEERLSVSVNGIPYPEDSYRYDARTGILAIDAPPAVCQTVSVRDDRSVFEKAADAIDMTQTAQALSYTKMHFYKKAKIRLEQWLVDSIKANGNVSVKKGLFTGTAKVKYSSGQINADGLDQYHYGYKGGEEGLKKLVKAIESGKSLSKSSLIERTKKFALFDFRVDLYNNKLKLKHNKSKTGKFLEDWGKFTLECAHTASSVLGNNGKKDSFTTGKYSQSKVALRFLNINVEKGYAIVGIITGRQWTQMGANVFKLHIEVPPEYDYPSYQVEKSFEENVKVTIRKKDTVTGKLLGGAKFDLYENGKKVAGSPFVTETDASKSDYGTVTYTYARKSEPYRIDIKKEDEISKKYKYCTNWDLLSASQQKKITGKGIYKSEKAAMKVLKEWCDRKIAEQREDFYAKVHTWKAVEIDPPDGHVIKKESISQTEDANESTITFAFADEEQTGAITIIKKAKMPDGKLSNKAKGAEAELSGAVYGIYAAETITGSDNRTVVYKKDAKVAEVKLKKKNNVYQAECKGLPVGTYRIRELKAPKGFVLSKDTATVSLKATDREITLRQIRRSVNMSDDEIFGTFYLKKLKKEADGVKVPEPQAHFNIFDKTGKQIYSDASGKYTLKKADSKYGKYSLITGADGTAALLEIPYGTYRITQTDANPHYSVMSGDSFTIKANGKTVYGNASAKGTYTNVRRDEGGNPFGRIRIEKHCVINDSGTGTYEDVPEDGAEFRIYQKEVYSRHLNPESTEGLCEIMVTGKDEETIEDYGHGVAVSGELDPGSYTVVQTAGTEGYALCEPFDVTVEKNQTKTYEYRIDNPYDGEKLIIDKKKKTTKETLPEENADFLVFDIEKARAFDDTSDAFGSFPYNEYLAEGESKGEERAYRLALKDYLTEHECVIGTMSSDKNGHAEMLLPAGSYGAEGFALLQYTGAEGFRYQPVVTRADCEDQTKEYAAKEKAGRIYAWHYTLTDEADFGYIRVEKSMSVGVDSDGKPTIKPEENAVFQILDADGRAVQGQPGGYPLVTNEEGWFKSDALEYGTYRLHQISGAKGHELSPDQVFTIGKETLDENKMYRDRKLAYGGIRLTNEETKVRVSIKKVEKEEDGSEHLLDGAIFQIVDNTTLVKGRPKVVASLETGKGDGQTEIPGMSSAQLKYGDYSLVEVRAPEGYQKAETIPLPVNYYTVSYDAEGNAFIEMTVPDEPVWGKIRLKKAGDGLRSIRRNGGNTEFVYVDHAIPGAAYALYAAQDIYSPDGKKLRHKAGEKICEKTTDENGEILFSRIGADGKETNEFYPGEYYIQETVSPERKDSDPVSDTETERFLGSYLKDDTRYDVTISASNADQMNQSTFLSPQEYRIDDSNRFAYAVFEEDGTLTFFRSPADYTDYDGVNYDGRTGTFEDLYGKKYTGTLYAGIESLQTEDMSMIPWFENGSRIKKVVTADDQVIRPKSLAYWFAECENLTDCDMMLFDTSQVEDMSMLFGGCTKLKSLIQQFDTSGVTSMNAMFMGCSDLERLDLSGFDTAKVTNMAYLFSEDASLECVLVSSLWSTASVTNSDGMFDDCTNLLPAGILTADQSLAHTGQTGVLTAVSGEVEAIIQENI